MAANKKPTRRIPDPLPKPPKPGKDDKKDLKRPKVTLPRSVGQLPYLVPKETGKEPKRLNLSATKKKK
jgi:hypothetical protein